VSGIGDDLFPEKCSQGNAKPLGVGATLTPVPACREDFLRIKLTSFDKLIEKTCSLIKDVRLYNETDQKPGGSTGNSGVAPDAVEIQLKSPNWLFGQRKLEESGPPLKVSHHEAVNGESHADIKLENFCNLNWLSSDDNVNEQDIFQRYLAMTSVNEVKGWYGRTLLCDEDENSDIYKHYAELCQGPALETFMDDPEKEKHYTDVLHMNTIDVVHDDAIEAEMEAALKEYNQIGADLGMFTTSCRKSLAKDSGQVTKWIIGEDKFQKA
jgi:hypothetical protein